VSDLNTNRLTFTQFINSHNVSAVISDLVSPDFSGV